jgi:hypothetical protein
MGSLTQIGFVLWENGFGFARKRPGLISCSQPFIMFIDLPPSWRTSLLEDDIRMMIAEQAFRMYLTSHTTGTPQYTLTQAEVPSSCTSKGLFVVAYNYYAATYPAKPTAQKAYDAYIQWMDSLFG